MASDGQGSEQGRGMSLAARLRAAVDERIDASRREEEARRARLERARRERAELLRDLAIFFRAFGHGKVSSTDDQVALRFDGRSLRFEAHGDADEVRVLGEGVPEGARLSRNEELGRWGLHMPGLTPRLLFDAGLEELIARAFELRPSSAAAAPSTEVTAGREASNPAPGRRGRSL